MQAPRKFRCPHCRALGGRVILWGLPGEEQAEMGYFIGGCMVEPDCTEAYDRGCLDCGHKWHSAHAIKRMVLIGF